MNVVNQSYDIAGVGHREPAQGEVEKEIENKGKHFSSSPDPPVIWKLGCITSTYSQELIPGFK